MPVSSDWDGALKMLLEFDDDAKELFEERSAIREFDGGLPRHEAERLAHEDVRQAMFHCEVASVVRMYREKGGEHVKTFLLKVEAERGSDAAARLRESALAQVRLGDKAR